MSELCKHEPLEWGTNCPQAPDRGPHECAGGAGCVGHHVCLRCGVWNLCHWCNEGNPRTQSSVSERMVHTDTSVGRVLCSDPPATPSAAPTQTAAPLLEEMRRNLAKQPIPPLLLQAYRALVKQHNSQAHYWSCNRGDKVCVCPLRELAEAIAAIKAEYPEAK